MYKKFAIAVLVLTPILVTGINAFLPQVSRQATQDEGGNESEAQNSVAEPGDAALAASPRGATSFFEDKPAAAGQPMLDPSAAAASAAPMVDPSMPTVARPAPVTSVPPPSAQPPVPVIPGRAAGPLVDPALSLQHLRVQKDGPQ